MGVLAETRHQSLPPLGTTVHAAPQALHHVRAKASWAVADCRAPRRERLHQALGETPVLLGLDETGDRKNGPPPAYVAQQDLGKLPTRANGVVAVQAAGLRGTPPFPLRVRVFTPATRRKPGEVSQTMPHVAVANSADLRARGLPVRVVVADGRSGASPAFIRARPRLPLPSGSPSAPPRGSGCCPARGGAKPAGGPSRASAPPAAASRASSARPAPAGATRSATTR